MKTTQKPRRHQRSRKKGAVLPEGVVCVTRPGKWGNPFETAEEFRDALSQIVDGGTTVTLACGIEEFAKMITIVKNIGELRGKDLACWCGLDKDCHADVLIEFANRQDA